MAWTVKDSRFYCTTSESSFGPTFDGELEAEGFVQWLGIDPRGVPDDALYKLVEHWRHSLDLGSRLERLRMAHGTVKLMGDVDGWHLEITDLDIDASPLDGYAYTAAHFEEVTRGDTPADLVRSAAEHFARAAP